MDINFIFDRKDYNLESSLEHANKLITSSKNIIQSINKVSNYNDEPKVFHYIASLKRTLPISDVEGSGEIVSGISFDKKVAIMKVVGEAIERYCLSVYRKNKFIYQSYKKLQEKAVNPFDFLAFSREQLKDNSFRMCRFNEETKFRWMQGISLYEKKKIFIPAQLVFVPYNYINEPVIRLPISTGAACSSSLSGALYKGICEVIERDSFMISYLNKITPVKIDLNKIKNQNIQRIIEKIKRYELELYILDITSDVKIPSILSLVIDRTGLGPPVSLGLKTDLDKDSAIVGAIEESLLTRSWIRDKMYTKKIKVKKAEDIETIEDRAFFWLDKSKINKINFLIKNNKIQNKKYHKVNGSINKLKHVLNVIKSHNMNVYFVDITLPFINRFGFKVVKVLIPELHPLYLNEKYKYLGCKKRMNALKNIGIVSRKLNAYPHPLL